MDCSFVRTPVCIYTLFKSGFKGVDWVNEFRLLGTAALLTAILSVAALPDHPYLEQVG